MPKLINGLKSIRTKLSSPTLVTLALLWLIFLLIVGTIEQKYIGLYAAQQKYFSSFIWAQWGFALPATKSVLVVICLGILAKISYLSVWKPRKLGNTLVHLGVLLLLAGTIISGSNKQEGYVVLEDLRQANQGGQVNQNIQNPIKNYMEDYYTAEILVREVAGDTGDINLGQEILSEYVFGQEELKTSAVLSTPQLPFNLITDELFTNVEIERVADAGTSYDPTQYTGFAKIFKLSNKKSELNAEENLSGAYFTVVDKQSGELVGKYGIFENMPIIQSINYDGKVFQVIMRPQRTALPFGLNLVDFSVDYHPASAVASSYKSEVNIYDGRLSQQREIITMNRPLRYKDWTIYQSAFNQEGDAQETSILVAVKNSGRLLPYIAGLIIAFGLLVHLFGRLPLLSRRAG